MRVSTKRTVSSARNAQRFRYRPMVEGLEERLPPGNLLSLIDPALADLWTNDALKELEVAPADPADSASGNDPGASPFLDDPLFSSWETGPYTPVGDEETESIGNQSFLDPLVGPSVDDALRNLIENALFFEQPASAGGFSPDSLVSIPDDLNSGFENGTSSAGAAVLSTAPTPFEPSGEGGDPGSLDHFVGQDDVLQALTILGVREDTGVDPTDGITRSDVLTVHGTGMPGTVLSLAVDGQANAIATVSGEGVWQATLNGTLGEGRHLIEATPVEGLGFSASYEVTIDRTPATVRVLAPEFTTETSPWVTIVLTTADGDGSEHYGTLDIDLNRDGDFDDEGELSYIGDYYLSAENVFYLESLPEGVYQLRARVTDVAGNLAISPVVTMQIDPYAGFLGSDYLLNLYADYLAAREGLELGDGSIGGESGEPTTSPSLPEEFFADRRHLFAFDEQGRVLISVRATLERHVDGLRSSLEELGMSVIHVERPQYMVIGYLPIDRLLDLESVPNFSAATPIHPPRLAIGATTTQGDAVIQADTFRNQFGLTGAGITVGVLSDSANRVGGGLAASRSTGDLPATVNVIMDGPAAGATDEGRAMLEIVHDIAPGAGLAFHTALNSPQVFANGIRALANAGARSIVDDVQYSNSPMFNDGIIAQAVDQVAARGVFYASAAGNHGNGGWQDTWRGVTATVGGVAGTFHNLATTGTDVTQDFTLAVNQRIEVTFQWDSAFLEGGSPAANFQVGNDLEVLLINATTGALIQRFNTTNPNTDEANEFVVFTNNGTFGTTQFALAFRLVSGNAPGRLRWVNMNFNGMAVFQGQGAPTIFGQPAARGAVATAAVPWFDPVTPEAFTARGGSILFLFDAQGNRLTTPEQRRKPDVAAPDGVNTTFFGTDIPQDPDTFPNFFGTSAAAPHVAAAAALLLQQAPTATGAQVAQHLRQTAVDIGPPGVDDLTGDGRIVLRPISITPGGGPVFPNDQFEPNNSSDVAANLGTLAATTLLDGLNINRIGFDDDDDWFRFQVIRNGNLTVTLEPESGAGDLDMRLYTLNALNTLVQLGQSTRRWDGLTEQIIVPVTPGMPLLLYIFGYDRALGEYRLTITPG